MPSADEYARRRGMNVRDALVFLVDFRVSMIRKDAAIDIAADICETPGASSLLSITLRCIADVMKTKIVARNSDSIAVVAFGCRGSETRKGWPGVRVLRQLKPADATGIKLLQGIAQRLEAGDGDELLEMETEKLRNLEVSATDRNFCFGADEPVEFDKALWAVRHHFTAMAAARLGVMHRKRVFVFTNDDDPGSGNRAVKQLSLTQAKDLEDMGASLDVSLLMSPSQMDTGMSEGPDSSTFFNDLVYTEDEGDDGGGETRGSVMIATIYSFDDLLTRVRKKEAKKRMVRKTVLVLADDYKIGVALYALVRKAKRPPKVELVAATNKPAFKITTATCESVGEVLKPEEIRYMFTPDCLKNARGKTEASSDLDETVAKPAPLLHGFKKSELAKAKALGPIGLVMYGFRKKSVLRREHTMGPSMFVYPDDTDYIGSTKAFTCLLKCMLKRGVVGLVSVRLREESGPGMRFAALVPQEEVVDEDVEKSVPGGFHLHELPYKDDIYTAWRKEMRKQEDSRVVNGEEGVGAEQEGEEAALIVKEEDMEASELRNEPESVSVTRRMVRKMKIATYSPSMFLNPDLQRFYAGLENAAGVESRYNPQDDLLNPDVAMLQEKGGVYAEEMKRLVVGAQFDGDALAEQFGTKTKKRGAETLEKRLKNTAEKQAAREAARGELDELMMLSMFNQGTLGKLLKADLQVYCRAHGLNERGKKQELIMAVEDHIASRQGK